MPKCHYTKHAMTVRSNGTVEPCCAWRNVDTPAIMYTDEILWKAKFNNITRELKTGWPAGCIECKVGEELGKTSHRSRSLKDKTFTKAKGIVYWDFKLNTTCNLACKMCGAHSSSTWKREVIKHRNLRRTYHADGLNNIKSFKEDDGLKIEEFYPYLVDARWVKFTGGEPFLIPEVKKCVEYLIEAGISKNIKLHFITNGTQDITKWMPLLEKFKSVWLTVSVDAMGDLYEYIRWGASWEQTSNNLKQINKLKPSNTKMIVTPLPMSLNYGRIKELTDWCDDHGMEYNIPIECIEPAIMSPKAVHDAELKEKLIEHLSKLDYIYGTDYKVVCPHLVD